MMLGSGSVFDLAEKSPVDVLLGKDPRERWLVLACGGDGTAAWILSALDEFVWDEDSAPRPVVALVPLGTGNDLALHLGWGATWDQNIARLWERLEHAYSQPLDRWRVWAGGVRAGGGGGASYTLNNYASFGCDAAVCHSFHALRESMPSLFSSRLGNKIFYTLGGTKGFFEEHVPLERACRLTVDGRAVKVPPDVYGIMILNISSYAGGADLWGKGEQLEEGEEEEEEEEDREQQSSSDGIAEVVGVTGTFNLGAAAVGLARGIRIARGRELALHFEEPSHCIYFQIDGEPAHEPLLTPAIVRMRLLDNRQRVLVPEK